MPNKSISLSGEVHISTEQVYTTVDALEALKAIGLAYGLYSRAEELRGQRVHLTGDEGHTALVVQEDFSCHGSPCWETVRTLTEDPAEIQQYMAFRDVLRIVQQRDREERLPAKQRTGDSFPEHPGKAEDPVSDEPHQFLTSGELDVNDLFSTKLQEGACTAHLRGVFTNTGEVEITLLKKNEELASPAFQAELNTLLGALRGDSGPLRDLPSMRAYCEARPQALMRGRQAFYAFRIDTGKYRYYLRFFPQRELHKFFIFCYQTDRLREDLPKPDFHYLNRRRKHQKREERS